MQVRGDQGRYLPGRFIALLAAWQRTQGYGVSVARRAHRLREKKRLSGRKHGVRPPVGRVVGYGRRLVEASATRCGCKKRVGRWGGGGRLSFNVVLSAPPPWGCILPVPGTQRYGRNPLQGPSMSMCHWLESRPRPSHFSVSQSLSNLHEASRRKGCCHRFGPRTPPPPRVPSLRR